MSAVDNIIGSDEEGKGCPVIIKETGEVFIATKNKKSNILIVDTSWHMGEDD